MTAAYMMGSVPLTVKERDQPVPLAAAERRQPLDIGAEPLRPYGGGTKDYNDLENKPEIEGVTLQGAMTVRQFGLHKFWFGTRAEYNALETIDPDVCYCIEEGT